METIYLDHNATTPLAPTVKKAMATHLEVDSVGYGNPSSGHFHGATAKAALDVAREQVAASIGASPNEIVFCGCGSEANNLALIGTAKVRLRANEDVNVVTSSIEHPAVLAPLDALTVDYPGRVKVTRVQVDAACRLDLDAFATAASNAQLVSVMLANNETGTVQPIEEVVARSHASGAIVHVDAAQALGKIPVHVDALGIDLMTIVGHKIGAPKGVAALYVRQGTPLVPLIFGGGHEEGRRAGTENTILAAGLGAACAQLDSRVDAMKNVGRLRDRLHAALRDAFGTRVVVNGDLEHRLPNTLHVSVLGVDASGVLDATPQVAASTGSACHEDAVTLSPVLSAMKVDLERGKGAFRLSLGPETTSDDVDNAARALIETISNAESSVHSRNAES